MTDHTSTKDSVFVPLLPYQGVIKKADGALFPDGEYDVAFHLYYNSGSKQEAVWSEKQKIRLTDGILSAYLGSSNPLRIPFDKQYNLQIAINSEVIEAGPLGAAAYSFISGGLTKGAVNSINGLTGSVEITGDNNLEVSKDKSGLKISLKKENGLAGAVTSGGKDEFWRHSETPNLLFTNEPVAINNTFTVNGASSVTGDLSAGNLSTGLVSAASADIRKGITVGLVEADNVSTSLLTATDAQLKNLQFGNKENLGKETISTFNLGDQGFEPAMTLQYNSMGSYFDFNAASRQLNYRGVKHNFYGPLKIINNQEGGIPDYMLEVGGRIKINNLTYPGLGIKNPQFIAADASGYLYKSSLPAQKWQGATDIYYTGGKVGIGTATPAVSLTIAKASADNGGIMLTEDAGGISERKSEESKWRIRMQNPSGSMASIGDDSYGLQISKNGISKFFLSKDGNLGLGTDNPINKLEVAGAIKAVDFKGSGAQLSGVVNSFNGCNGAINFTSGNNVLIASNPTKPGSFEISSLSSADNLGNHTATQNVKLSGKWLSNDGGNEGIAVTQDGKVGIGKADPLGMLHIDDKSGFGLVMENSAKRWHINIKDNGLNFAETGVGDGDNRFRITAGGKIGIGTPDPQSKLEIKDIDPVLTITDVNQSGDYRGRPEIRFTGNDLNCFTSDDNLISQSYHNAETFGFYSAFNGNRQNNASIRVFGKSKTADNWGNYIEMTHNGDCGLLQTEISSQPLVLQKHAGKVLIGCETAAGKAADAKLVVHGKIAAEKIVVVTNVTTATNTKDGEISSETARKSWPDYVFDSEYQMLSLSETEKFIKTNKHLPEVPSRAEVLNDGVNLGDMQHILLKKVEELTLHVIELEKKNKLLEDKLNGMGR